MTQATGESTTTTTATDEGKPNSGVVGEGVVREFIAPKDQAELDKMLGERLNRERAKYADYDELKKKAAEHDKTVEAQKTEAEKLAERAAAAEKAAGEHQLRALRAEVALAKKLTPSQAKRIVGSTKEELEADADELLKDLAVTPAKPTSFDGGPRGGGGTGTARTKATGLLARHGIALPATTPPGTTQS
jgi:hypothetical protein